jgi:hypothetical protein
MAAETTPGSFDTPHSLRSLGRLTSVRYLTITEGPKVTSEGIKHLTSLPNLRYLHLQLGGVDDGVVKHLKQIPSLRVLKVQETKISPAAVAELERSLPMCTVLWDGRASTTATAPAR